MLEEISESAAQSPSAEIYAQIRTSCGVARVSSLRRSLASQSPPAPEMVVFATTLRNALPAIGFIKPIA